MSDRQRWEEIQVGEFDYHRRKNEAKVRDHTIPYWKALIGALPEQIRFGPQTRVLDLGCGGCGVLLGLDGGRRVGVDPLMPQYLEKFPFLRDYPIRWLTGTAEEIDVDEKFDVIFCINAFDHVFDPPLVAANVTRLLSPGGHAVITMNTHNTRLFRTYYRRLYRFIDPHHPHQFTAADIETLFAKVTPVVTRPIDDLWHPFAKDYYREVLGRPLEDRRKWIKGALNPFKWPMGFCKFVLDMPPNAKRPGQRSIFTNRLYVFRRDPTGSGTEHRR